MFMLFGLFARKSVESFGLPIFRLWAYLMKVIFQIHVVCTKLDTYVFVVPFIYLQAISAIKSTLAIKLMFYTF